MTTQIKEQDGRQGITGHGVRYVLAISLVGAIVASGIVYFLMFR